MNRSTLIILSLIAFIAGMLMLAIQQQWILFQLPGAAVHARKALEHQFTKKKVAITILKNDIFYCEQRLILWPVTAEEQIEHSVIAWLALLDEETRDVKKMNLQSVCIDPNGQIAYISFDRSPFNKQWPIIKKWHLIESLLTTVKENGILIHGIQLMIDHKPIVDAHLDFSKPWPLEGFISMKMN